MRRQLIVFAAVATLFSCGEGLSDEDRFLNQPWEEPSGEVAVALGRNGIKGCGEFYQKRSSDGSSEYFVACTRNQIGQDEWVGYLVWPNIDEVTGPDRSAIYRLGGPPRPDPRPEIAE